MIKTHPKSKMVQFHHNSVYARKLLGTDMESNYTVLQLEPVTHSEYDFIAEIVDNKDLEVNND